MNKKILIIEDDQGIIDVMKIILSEYYIVSVIKNTDGIIKKIAKEMPDLIIMDLWVPGKDGKDLPKKIKTNLLLSKIPVLIVSANHNIKMIAKSMMADGYMSKPFDIDQLLNLIKSHLK